MTFSINSVILLDGMVNVENQLILRKLIALGVVAGGMILSTFSASGISEGMDQLEAAATTHEHTIVANVRSRMAADAYGLCIGGLAIGGGLATLGVIRRREGSV